MSKRTIIITSIFIAIACLAGCEKSREVVLDEAEIKGSVKVVLVKRSR